MNKDQGIKKISRVLGLVLGVGCLANCATMSLPDTAAFRRITDTCKNSFREVETGDNARKEWSLIFKWENNLCMNILATEATQAAADWCRENNSQNCTYTTMPSQRHPGKAELLLLYQRQK